MVLKRGVAVTQVAIDRRGSSTRGVRFFDMNGQANNDVVVVGAGITGLATAYFLQREGARVTVIEKSGRPGGVIRSVRMDGFLFEHGPSSMPRLTPFLDALFTDLEIRKAVEFASANATKRYIVR